MKKQLSFASIILLLFGITNLSAETIDSNPLTFTITGKIDGLATGDTIFFENIILPEWALEPAFNIAIDKPDKFYYKGNCSHTQYYLMTYKPASGKKIVADRRGITLLISKGSYDITGTADNIYYSQITGGIYNDSCMQRIISLENFLGLKRSSYMKLSEDAISMGDTLKAEEYSNKFNFFSRDHQKDYEKRHLLEEEFATNFPSSEWVIIDLLQKSTFTPVEKLQTTYEKMDQKARESYYGKILKQEIDKIAKLAPGKNAPEFNLVTLNGDKVSSKDVAGSYYLFYHWGLCPGSIMIDKEVTDFYNQYKEHIKIIGITDDINMIHDVNKNVKPADKVMDIELKPVLENMLAHPWPDAESKGNNEQVGKDYAFAGLPFFVFVSPEGKIILRGFSETFYKTKETIQSEFGKEAAH